MSYGRKRVEISLGDLSDILGELNKYDVGDTVSKKAKKIKSSSNKKIYDLPEFFWENIREEISDILVSNYNKIKVMNTPKYTEWKRRAKADGISVVVTTDEEEANVLYIRGSLRTGFLRERISHVEVKKKKISVSNVSSSSIEYFIDISDLLKNYGRRFAKKVSKETGKDLFLLTDQQVNEILENVLSKIISNS